MYTYTYIRKIASGSAGSGHTRCVQHELTQVYVCVCIHICMYVLVCNYIGMHVMHTPKSQRGAQLNSCSCHELAQIFVFSHTHTHTNTHIYTRTHTRTHTHTHTHKHFTKPAIQQVRYVYTCKYTRVYLYTHVRVCICIHPHLCGYLYAYI